MARNAINRPCRSFAPGIELLEDRSLPATFGISWPDPNHLTLSFAPDGTDIVGRPSNLFQTLNQWMPTETWQREILRAIQTWLIHTNVNVGVVADGGQPFGIAGPTQRDSRFGDIRVAAHAMAADVLSVSIPHDPFLSGTWAGDMFLNSAGPLTADNLFAVALHEASHLLGLDHSSDPDSPRFSHLNDRTTLTPGDITAIQALYGTRAPDSADAHANNDTITRATLIRSQHSEGRRGEAPVVVFGDITTSRDVDYFRLRPLGSYAGPVSFRLQSSGISLLAPRLTLLDARGQVLDQAQSTRVGGDVVTLRLEQVDPQANYFVRVEGVAGDGFNIGRYGLAVTYDARLITPPQRLDAVLRGPYETLEAEEVDRIFERRVFIRDDERPEGRYAGDFEQAVPLHPTRGFPHGTRYDTIASLTTGSDVDLYRVRSPRLQDSQPPIMTVTLSAAPVNGMVPRVTILDQFFNPVPAQVLVNSNGAYTIQSSELTPNTDYYLRVYASPYRPDRAGNYAVLVDFGQPVVELSSLVSGALSPLHSQDNYAFYVAQSQLFQFNLSARDLHLSMTGQVRMTIFDEEGRVVFSLLAFAGDTTTSEARFLTPGTYTVRITAEGGRGSSLFALAYTLTGINLSEPIGPRLSDPTLAPQFSSPTTPDLFYYPGGIISLRPFFFVSLPRLVLALPDTTRTEGVTVASSELLNDSLPLVSPVFGPSALDE